SARYRSVIEAPHDPGMTHGAGLEGRRPFFFAPPPSSQPGGGTADAIHEAFVVDGSPAQRAVVARAGALVGLILGAGVVAALALGGDLSARDLWGLGAAALALGAATGLLRLATPPPL